MQRHSLLIGVLVLIAVFSIASFARLTLASSATTIGTNISTTGNLTVGGTATITGATTFPLTKGYFLVGNDSGITQATSSIFISSTGNVGIGTTAPLAGLHVGNYNANNSTDSQILISRSVDDTGYVGSGHAFSDSSNVNRNGSIGYASYDNRITVSGSYNYDHFNGFQAAPVIGTSGITTNVYGSTAAPTINVGTATNVIGLKVYNPLGTGTVNHTYALYVQNQTKGSVDNYSIYSEGGLNYLGGVVGIGHTPLSSVGIYYNTTLTGATAQYGILSDPAIDSTGTSAGYGYYSAPSTVASSFTLVSAIGMRLADWTKGSGSTIASQYGLFIDDQTKGTSNYGIYSNVSSGTNKYNLYLSGNAINYFAGSVGIGTTTPVANLQVTAALNATTTMEIGRAGSNKGSCIKLYDATGVAWYYTPAVGTGALTSASASSCASVSGF